MGRTEILLIKFSNVPKIILDQFFPIFFTTPLNWQIEMTAVIGMFNRPLSAEKNHKIRHFEPHLKHWSRNQKSETFSIN